MVDKESWMLRGSFGRLWRTTRLEGVCGNVATVKDTGHPHRCKCAACAYGKSVPSRQHLLNGSNCGCGIYGNYSAGDIQTAADVVARTVHWGAVQEWTGGVKSQGFELGSPGNGPELSSICQT